MLKKFGCFLGLCFYALGSIGGLGYCLYSGAWLIAIAVVILGIMAFPTAKKLFKELTD
jgi:uncharacterized membrane protein